MADDGPLGMVSTFKPQKLDGDTVKGAWRRKVNQYVLGLEEQTIFGRRSDSSAHRAIISQQGSDMYGVEYLSLSTADKFGVLCWFR
jgi:hypothetical protein